MKRVAGLNAWSPTTLKSEKFWPMDLFTRALVLLVANKLGVFAFLAGGSREVAEIAKVLRADVKGMRILLDALVALDYLKKADGLYENRRDTARHLTETSEEFIGTRFLHSYKGLARWLRLEDMVRHGQGYQRKLPEFQRSPLEEKKRAREFALGLDESSRETAALVAGMLDLRGVKNLLDVGGGAGTYAIAFARRWPSVRPTVFELPVPARVAREQAKKAGLGKNISVITGDFLTDGLGVEVYDAVFLSNIIHNLNSKENLMVLGKVWTALRGGGRIFVKDMMPNDRRDGPYYPLIFGLTMLMFTDAGDTYPESEVMGWLKQVGFSRVNRKTVIRGESSLVIGRKK